MTQYRREIQRSLLSHVKTVHLSGSFGFHFHFLERFIYASIVWLFFGYFFAGALFNVFLASATLGGFSYLTSFLLRLFVWHYGFGFLIWARVSDVRLWERGFGIGVTR